MLIKPSLGRIVWFTPAKGDSMPTNPDGRCAAIVTCVHSDSMVNLCVFDANGLPRPCGIVPLVQQNAEAPGGYFCEWMPYQLDAARRQAAEGK